MKRAAAVGVQRQTVTGGEPAILADIYRDDVNLCVWQRRPDAGLNNAVEQFIDANPRFQHAVSVSPGRAQDVLTPLLTSRVAATALVEDIAELVDMYCCLFGQEKVGLRLSVLDRAMCPKFHVDLVLCRLVTTYLGAGTEWLAHEAVDRSKLGSGSGGKPDHESGLYRDSSDIQQLQGGDVALLKGEAWEGNENAGLVHRSPSLGVGERRLLLTLDMVAD
jgi:hypothetical protein